MMMPLLIYLGDASVDVLILQATSNEHCMASDLGVIAFCWVSAAMASSCRPNGWQRSPLALSAAAASLLLLMGVDTTVSGTYVSI